MIIENKKQPTDLLTHDFYYDLPEELIAQHPSERRDASRLLVIDKNTGQTRHKIFRDIIDELHSGDVLVVNDSTPAVRIFWARNPGSAALRRIWRRRDFCGCVIR